MRGCDAIASVVQVSTLRFCFGSFPEWKPLGNFFEGEAITGFVQVVLDGLQVGDEFGAFHFLSALAA